MWPDEVEVVSQRIDGDGVIHTTNQTVSKCRITDLSKEFPGPDGTPFVASFKIYFPPGTPRIIQSDVINIRKNRGVVVMSHGPLSNLAVKIVRQHGISGSRYQSVVC